VCLLFSSGLVRVFSFFLVCTFLRKPSLAAAGARRRRGGGGLVAAALAQHVTPVAPCLARALGMTCSSDGFEKVLIGTRGARETFLRGRKGRAAKNSVLTSGVKQLKC
jgi:hypothetical protein